jgi:hypothetical protein
MKSEAIQGTIRALRDSAAQLDVRIIEPRTKEYLLRPALNALRDVETFLLPNALKAGNGSRAAMWFTMVDFQLAQAERQIGLAKDLVSNYGTSLQLIV